MYWIVSAGTSPHCFIKAESRQEAIEKFKKGWTRDHGPVLAIAMTLEWFDRNAPDEFCLTKDASF